MYDLSNKYGFNLVLAGNTGNAESLSNLRKRIGNNKKIKIKGFVSDEELAILYNKAKVFALPSLNEGVGLVALEAAVCGCNIVLTQLGGPKEYYPTDMINLVDPYNVDSIGTAVLKALDNDAQQPLLRNFILNKYNINGCVNRLITSYQNLNI